MSRGRNVYFDLTPRQKQVLRLIVKGLSNRKIAKVLIIEEATVESHTNNIYERLGVHNRTAAAVRGLREGLLDDDEEDDDEDGEDEDNPVIK